MILIDSTTLNSKLHHKMSKEMKSVRTRSCVLLRSVHEDELTTEKTKMSLYEKEDIVLITQGKERTSLKMQGGPVTRAKAKRLHGGGSNLVQRLLHEELPKPGVEFVVKTKLLVTQRDVEGSPGQANWSSARPSAGA